MIECEICAPGVLARYRASWIHASGPVFEFEVCAAHAAEARSNGAAVEKLED